MNDAEAVEQCRLRCQKELRYLATLPFSHPRFQQDNQQAEVDEDAPDSLFSLFSEEGDDEAGKKKGKGKGEGKKNKKKSKKRKPRGKK